MTSNEGFSVVAPMSVTVPSSTCGRMTSCWALLKRWISSMKRIVRWPYRARRSRASATMRRRSPTPAVTAEIGSKCDFVWAAMMRASVVLPLPGGPQKIIDGTWSDSMRRRSSRSSPTRCSWPDELVEGARAHAGGQRRLALALGAGALLEHVGALRLPSIHLRLSIVIVGETGGLTSGGTLASEGQAAAN